ncbi:MAG TPA: PucR family transcriptional regulator ligand-binding domain-containing protein [Bacillales bacterium]|nr:PucR family transcriptional regulator ligand-binding domain-containing protein [Bacillales bacterium]
MLTVADVLAMELMEQAAVKSARDDLVNRPVEGVSVIELPVEDFVKKNELVLTTGIGCDDRQELQKYVEDVEASEAAGLCVAVGRHIPEIPPSVIDYCDDRHFPIIEIPWKLRFADITQQVLQELSKRRQLAAQQSEKTQQQLLNLILHGGDLTSISQYILEQTKKPAVIIDEYGSVQGMSRGSEQLLEQWRAQAANDETESIRKIPIRSASHVQGIILFPAADRHLDGGQEDWLLEHASTAAALWFLRENAVKETEWRMRGDFVWSLTKGDYDNLEAAEARAKANQFNLRLSYVCLLGKCEIDLGDPAAEMKMRQTVTMLQQLQDRIDLRIMATYKTPWIVVFLEGDQESALENARKLFKAFDEAPQMISRMTISWGIGENRAGVGTFRESYESAQSALDIGMRLKGPGFRTAYGDIPMYRALALLAQNEEIRKLTEDVIGKLIRYQQEKRINMLQTARSYIQHKGNISKTARALHLHRQSLVYRLQKIETLTQKSFDNPDDVFLIDLCMKIWEAGMSGSSTVPPE